MEKTACKCLMKCTANNEMECEHYQPSDVYEGERIMCIYNDNGECNEIIANQKAILDNLNLLFSIMDETINARQDTINIVCEQMEEINVN